MHTLVLIACFLGEMLGIEDLEVPAQYIGTVVEQAEQIRDDEGFNPAMIDVSQGVSWLEEYRLGPNDKVNINFYGRPTLQRLQVPIGPDGRISYLNVTGLFVNNLTIDELRVVLEQALGEYYTDPHLMVFPEQINSKRYTIIGKVSINNVFSMDEPITLLEAIAKARGFSVGIAEARSIELSDLGRSFIARNGRILDVDFTKLYFEGDLSQNIYLEPGDYIYIASAVHNSVYVLGAVPFQGDSFIVPNLGVVGAITTRGGFTDDAWTDKVLLIRGSLQNPQTIIVDVQAIMTGQTRDIRVLPNDIIFIANHPWTKAREVLDDALDGFVESASSEWVDRNMPELINKPVLPKTRWKKSSQTQ